MLTEIKIAIGIAFLVVAVVLGVIAAKYHDAWIEAEKKVVQVTAERDSFSQAAKTCSDNTIKLFEATADKEKTIVLAQAQAAKVAKVNETMAQALLTQRPAGVDTCKAAIVLFNSYKVKKEEAAK